MAARADSGEAKRPVMRSGCCSSGMPPGYPPSAARNRRGLPFRQMTEPDPDRRCRYCRRPLPVAAATGRPREFCRASCRQQDYLRRSRPREVGLSEHELVVTRGELDELHDLLYVLEAAVEDVDRDLAAGAEPGEALAWLLDAARPLTAHRLGQRREPLRNAENPRSVK